MVAIPTGIISAGFVEQYQTFKKIGDYGIEKDIRFIRITLTENDSWNEQAVRDIGLPQNSIIAAIQRDGKMIIPNGSTVLKDGDILTMGAEPGEKDLPVRIQEIKLRKNHPWTDNPIRDLDISRRSYIVLVKRDGKSILPYGDLVLLEGDQVFTLSQERQIHGA